MDNITLKELDDAYEKAYAGIRSPDTAYIGVPGLGSVAFANRACFIDGHRATNEEMAKIQAYIDGLRSKFRVVDRNRETE